MTKKKIIWAFALIVCLIIPAMFTLTACGGNKNGNNEKVDKLETASGVVASGEFSKSDNLVCNTVDVTSQEGQTAIAKIVGLDYNAKKNVYIYDIHIVNNKNAKVQPNGKVKITMPAVAESALGFITFHIKENGTVESLETTYANGKISFETESFSNFIIGEKAQKYDFKAEVQNNNGKIFHNNVDKGTTFELKMKEDDEISLTAVPNDGYEFDGWYKEDDALISKNITYTFKMGTTAQAVVAKFNALPAVLMSFEINVADSGLKANGKTLKHKGATEDDLNLNKVIVNGVMSDGTKVILSKDLEYTIDLGGLDLNEIGTYTVTFASVSNISIKKTFEIEVREFVIEYTYLENGYGESLNKAYDGGALFVASNAIIINGKSLREINDVVNLGSLADENLLATCQALKDKVSYKWVIKGTDTVVQPAKDVTMPGKSYAYNRRAVGDELVGPATVGEYEFIFSFEINGNLTEQFRREGKIEERKFKKITSADEFTTDTGGVGLFASLCYYTIVGIANGNPYVMQMPMDVLEAESLSTVEAGARLALSDGYEGILLGSSYDTVFTKYYYNNIKKYYPATGSNQTLLWEFGTGHYGTRLEKYSANFAYDLFGTGTMRLSGDKIVRSLDVNKDHGLMFNFANDGAVTIYSPYQDSENCALRLVKNADGTFAFTGKDSTTDARESYPVYIYSYYVPITEKYQFTGDKGSLYKEYDGNPITFNAYKDFNIFNYEIDNLGALIKNEMRGKNGGQYRFAYSNAKGGKGYEKGYDKGGDMMPIAITPNGIITGPSEVGDYLLYFQKLEVEKDGSTYWQTMGYGSICSFQIYSN